MSFRLRKKAFSAICAFAAVLFLLVLSPHHLASGQTSSTDVSPTVAPSEMSGIAAEAISDEVGDEFKALLATEIPETNLEVMQTRGARALMAGHGKAIQQLVSDMATKLGFAGDPKDVTVVLNADSAVNAFVQTDPSTKKVRIELNAGLISFVKNQDELALVLAHEMTHMNPNVLRHRQDSGVVEKITSSIPKQIKGRQAEELRADLGAVQRMIKGGYNPWGAYDFFKRLSEKRDVSGNTSVRTLAAMISTHPDPQLRMSVVKSYITAKQAEENLMGVTSKYNGFPKGLEALRWRLSAYRGLADLNKAKAGIAAVATVGAQVATALLVSPETADTMGVLLRPGTDVIGLISSVKEFMISPGELGSPVASSYSPTGSSPGLVSSVTTEIVEKARYLKDVPLEKVGVVLGSLAGSGAAGRWAINRVRADAKKASDAAKFDALVNDLLENSKSASKIRLAISRTEKAIQLYAELHRKGQFDRTKVLESALSSNLSSWGGLGFNDETVGILRKHGYERSALEAINARLAHEASKRQLILNEVVRDSIAKLPADRTRGMIAIIEKIPEGWLTNPNIKASIEGIVEVAKERDPSLRLSTRIERLYLVQNQSDRLRVQLRESREVTPLAGGDSAVRLREAMTYVERLQTASRTVRPPMGSPVPKGASVNLVQVRRVKDENVAELVVQNIDAWLKEVEVPGERGARAEKTLKAAVSAASDLLDKYHADNKAHTEFNEKIVEALTRLVPQTDSVRLIRVASSLELRSSYRRMPSKIPGRKPKEVRVDLPASYRGLEKYRNLYLRKLEGAKSVVELDDMVQKLFIEGEGLRPDEPPISQLYRHMEAHPEFLKSADDVDRLLKSPYLWNQLGTGYGDLDEKILEDMRARYGNSQSQADLWKYRPEASERQQKRILAKLEELGKTPQTLDDRIKLWQMFVGRGVTNTTDTMFSKLYEEADPKMRAQLREISQGRIWEPRLRASLLKDRIAETPEYRQLVETSRDGKLSRESEKLRISNLRKVIRVAEREFDSRGPDYDRVVESVLNDIRSSAIETRYAERYRGSAGQGQSDLTMRTLSGLVERMRKMEKEEKWDFILWLRGEKAASPNIEKMFPAVGSDRVARMYSLLPDFQKALVIDSVLDSKEGLLPTADVNSFWGRKIVDHLIGGSNSDSVDTAKNRQIAREILESYLASFDGPGANKAQRTLVLSYMLASKSGDGSNGKVLKQVLEAMGASGVKIGQFLVATDILGDEENKALRGLQDQANVPYRTRIYEDLAKAKGIQAPKKIDDLLGAASIKYAVKGFEVEDGNPFVLKVLRAEADATIDQQFARLRSMSDSLVKKYGGKYGVLRSVIRASEEAVRRELKLVNETKSSSRAAEVYGAVSDFEVPKEQLVDPTLIKSDFAHGGSIHDLDLEARGRVATRIMEVERDILFADKEVIEFDPDRHPGNFKVEIGADDKVKVRPIDFGQFIQITKSERDQVIDLFAQSAILDKTGPTRWSVDRIAESLKLSPAESAKLMKSLKSGFPSKNRTGLASYYTLLAALEDAGKPQPIQFFDFARAVVQHNQYEDMAVTSLMAKGMTEQQARSAIQTPRERLVQLVQASADRQIANSSGVPDFSRTDKARIVWNRTQKMADEVLGDLKTQTRAAAFKKVVDPTIVFGADCAKKFNDLKLRLSQ